MNKSIYKYIHESVDLPVRPTFFEKITSGRKVLFLDIPVLKYFF